MRTERSRLNRKPEGRKYESEMEKKAFEDVLLEHDECLVEMMGFSGDTLPERADRETLIRLMRKDLSRGCDLKGDDVNTERFYQPARLKHYAMAVMALDTCEAKEYSSYSELHNQYQYLRTRRFSAADKMAFREASARTDREALAKNASERLGYPFTQRTLARCIRTYAADPKKAQLRIGCAVLWQKLEDVRISKTGAGWCRGPWDLLPKVERQDSYCAKQELAVRSEDAEFVRLTAKDAVASVKLLNEHLPYNDADPSNQVRLLESAFELADSFSDKQMRAALQSISYSIEIEFPATRATLTEELRRRSSIRSVSLKELHSSDELIAISAAWLCLGVHPGEEPSFSDPSAMNRLEIGAFGASTRDGLSKMQLSESHFAALRAVDSISLDERETSIGYAEEEFDYPVGQGQLLDVIDASLKRLDKERSRQNRVDVQGEVNITREVIGAAVLFRLLEARKVSGEREPAFETPDEALAELRALGGMPPDPHV